MNLSAVIIRKLRSIYQKRPLWLGSLYYNSPSWIKRLVEKQIVKIRPTYESKPLKKLSLFPLDFAWAEAIFAPFHDPMISPSLPIEFKPINAQGCAVQYFWCWIILSWKNCPDNMDAASLHLTTEVDLSGYDTLLFCLTMSKEVSARFRLKLNNEWKEHVNEFRGNGKRMEITL
jgi:hypothetical protein